MKNQFIILLSAMLFLSSCSSMPKEETVKLNDMEIAHIAYTAGEVDVQYAKIALKRADSKAVRDFANVMLRDHSAVNVSALNPNQQIDAMKIAIAP